METKSSDQAEREDLIRLIENAFDGVQRGKGITLHQADVIDEYGSEEEEAEARKLDTEKRWQDIPEDWIQKENSFSAALCFLDPQGFRYYIPAFMIFAIRHYDDASSLAGPDFTIYAFKDERMWRETWALLNKEQKEAVAEFLRFMATGIRKDHADHLAAQKLLDYYWHSFLLAEPPTK